MSMRASSAVDVVRKKHSNVRPLLVNCENGNLDVEPMLHEPFSDSVPSRYDGEDDCQVGHARSFPLPETSLGPFAPKG